MLIVCSLKLLYYFVKKSVISLAWPPNSAAGYPVGAPESMSASWIAATSYPPPLARSPYPLLAYRPLPLLPGPRAARPPRPASTQTPPWLTYPRMNSGHFGRGSRKKFRWNLSLRSIPFLFLFPGTFKILQNTSKYFKFILISVFQ